MKTAITSIVLFSLNIQLLDYDDISKTSSSLASLACLSIIC